MCLFEKFPNDHKINFYLINVLALILVHKVCANVVKKSRNLKRMGPKKNSPMIVMVKSVWYGSSF